jgi:putative transposase
MEMGYRFRIYPTPEQEVLIRKTLGCARFVYNHYLDMRKMLYKAENKTMGYKECSADLTGLKKELEWLKEPDSIALQSSLEHLQDGYDNFFAARKRSDLKWGLPVFKRKKDNHQSYETKHVNGNIQMFDKHIRLPKLGLVQCRISKQVQGRILNVTVSRTPTGKCFVSICCTDIVHPRFEKTGSAVGIDLGLKDFATDSGNKTYENHRFHRKHEKKLARLQRRQSRKQIGSKNREKARVKVALMHEYVANCRVDAHHKLTTQFVRDHDIIIIEDLRVRNMVKNRKLSKAISDVGWGEFAKQLEYKSAWYGKKLVKTDTYFASTQMCSTPGCSHKNVGTRNLNVREWRCPECGTHHDRDGNAALNILNEGLRLLSA